MIPVIDGLAPGQVERPRDVQELADVMSAADRRRRSVVPIGGGTALGLGYPPQSYDIAVDTTAMSGICSYEPADLTVTVRAGTRFADLQATLATNGQYLPLDVAPNSTVGGVLAANSSGLWRASQGTARDVTVGMRFVRASGEPVTTGGRVVKNVAGYDLSKLLIGSLGTIGVIAEASFKIYPLPAGRRVGIFPALELEPAFQLAHALRLPGGWRSLMMMRTGRVWQVAIELVGRSTDVISQQVESITGYAAQWSEDDTALEDARRLLRAGPVRVRISVPKRSLADVLARTDCPAVLCLPSAGVATCVWRAAPASGDIRRLRSHAESNGGALVLMEAPEQLKREVGVWGTERPEIALMRRIRAAFDPHRTLSPGRFVV